ncbi:MAG: hypothetical protein HY986_07090 [Candidatus Melainabacteria bacterium]|nr:hypothetical protein [Candidatus Melainabacteria bacterium]
MRKLHPLRIGAISEHQYLFLFRSADGDKEFSFSVKYSGYQYITDISYEYDELTDSDMATRCISCVIGFLDEARLKGGVKFGSLTEKCEPIAIEYKGECREGAFRYLVTLKDAVESIHQEEVVVSYKDPVNVLLWSGGQCSFGFDRMAMLEVKEPKPEFYVLLNAVLNFDESRYLPSFEDEEPMKIELS